MDLGTSMLAFGHFILSELGRVCAARITQIVFNVDLASCSRTTTKPAFRLRDDGKEAQPTAA